VDLSAIGSAAERSVATQVKAVATTDIEHILAHTHWGRREGGLQYGIESPAHEANGQPNERARLVPSLDDKPHRQGSEALDDGVARAFAR